MFKKFVENSALQSPAPKLCPKNKHFAVKLKKTSPFSKKTFPLREKRRFYLNFVYFCLKFGY
jgi:hypothetical protein